MKVLTPVQGCLVVNKNNNTQYGLCYGETVNRENHVNIRWLNGNNTVTSIHIKDIDCGFRVGMSVIDNTPYSFHQSMGQGVILQQRSIGNNIQLLVEFQESGNRVWLPYQYLQYIKSTKDRFFQADISISNEHRNRFLLRTLSYAIDIWNENTGSLSALDIDPLPHQIGLVHDILSSGNFNWLIADDVGLGKTIETGMLIHALQKRGVAKRILLVTPAGLLRQWQEELATKFNLTDFEIFGVDFTIKKSKEWKMHDFVIGSIDTLKTEKNLEHIKKSGQWDLVIFDESHKLSRKQEYNLYTTSERYKLAQQLRKLTPSMILLSATPHQGEHDKFISLLELLRPDRKKQITSLAINPHIIGDMVYRNHKEYVTDLDGEFIFKGKVSNIMQIPSSEVFNIFEEELKIYLKFGYSASESGQKDANVIGLVMTAYRKLASSSIMAIKTALERRLAKLKKSVEENKNNVEDIDDRFSGEYLENHKDMERQKEFFKGEIPMLEGLLPFAEDVINNDIKLNYFLNNVITKILDNNKDEKVLIFSEYKSTQNYIKNALEKIYGEDCICLINGSMSYKERQESIQKFEATGRFLISTEAGGEGINLQRKCHVMINYDLPWNPMRLMQRIGRLYRYGQKKTVVVFNLYQTDSIDQSLLLSMYRRIDSIVDDLAQLKNNEFNEGLKDEILGEMSHTVEVENILANASVLGIKRTEDKIKEALEQAKTAVNKQRQILSYANSSNADSHYNELVINESHLNLFFEGMLQQNNIQFTYNKKNQYFDIKFDEKFKEVFKQLLGKKTNLRATFNRETLNEATEKQNIHMLDFDSPIMRYFINQAKSYDFGGSVVFNDYQNNGISGLFVALLKWQNPQGIVNKQQLCICTTGKWTTINQQDILVQLIPDKANVDMPYIQNPNIRHVAKKEWEQANDMLNNYIANNSNEFLQPHAIDWIGCSLNTQQS